MSTTPDPRISQQVWDTIIVPTCALHGVDPYLIAAIAGHETGYGQLGDGRMPPLGSGHILGVGSYDSGSTSQWAGWGPQVEIGCNTLVANGVRTIADIKAGKLHVQANGHIPWASADTAPGFPWSNSVIAIWNSYDKTPPTPEGFDVSTLPTLKQGSNSYTVRAAKALLREAGHIGAADDTSNFGPALTAAVQGFQKTRGLPVDGVIGTGTWAVLLGAA